MLVWCSLMLTVVFVLIALANVLAAPRLSKSKKLSLGKQPFVSVLVPARNEAHQISACIGSLLANQYSDFEVIVGDDQSTDGTGAVVAAMINERAAALGPTLKLLTINQPPPLGWTGKARTCQELANQARGEILVFCDADVNAAPEALAGTVALLNGYRADTLSALPRQLGGSALVQALVAVVTQFSILISLPLMVIPRSKNPSLATGNGQWMAWRRSAYLEIGGHEAVRTSRIEDVALARLVKEQGLTLIVALATRELTVRMYESLAAARLGFRKNLFALLGDSWVAACASLVTTVALLLAPILALATGSLEAGVALLSLNLVLLLAQRLAFRTPWSALVRLPLGIVVAMVVLCESVVYSRRGVLVWKDRSLVVE